MTRFNWNETTGHKENPASVEKSQATENPLTHRRDSKLGHVMDSIRHALAFEHENLPKTNPPEQQQVTLSSTNGSISPALQAVASSKLNENAMGEEPQWGWPGLGTYTSYDSITAQNSKPRTASAGSIANTQARAEAATFEAIDNAAESESCGWPGLGTWTTSSKK